MATCETCRFRRDSFCKRYPPVRVGYMDSRYPYTKPSNWCGEHRSKSDD